MEALPIVILAIAAIALYSSFFIVHQQTAGLVERFGRYNRTCQAGLNFKIPLIESVRFQSLQVQQIPIFLETKTKDNVFVKIAIAVQVVVLRDKIMESVYMLSDAKKQISSYVFDMIRSIVPKKQLDDFYESQEELANSVKEGLVVQMQKYGYDIVSVLVTEITPDDHVKIAMNEINAATRLKTANEQKGEAEKILIVKNAEADAEAKRQIGIGTANQRKEIIKGFQEAILEFKQVHPDVDTDGIMTLILTTQYFDTLKHVGERSNTLMLPHNMAGVSQLVSEISAGIQTAKGMV